MKYTKLLLFILLLASCSTGNAQSYAALKAKAVEVKAYCSANNMNTDICFLVDMNIHSGKYRMFIWDFEKDTILDQGKCSHGCCDNGWSVDQSKAEATFSNVPESHCSSMGKFKIGNRGWSNFGIHVNYKLHGLEVQNNNAYKRYIVFHSWNIMENEETYPRGAPESWGCPAVSNEFMRIADKHLQATNGNVLLWIYQ
jgi:hypothetical protein